MHFWWVPISRFSRISFSSLKYQFSFPKSLQFLSISLFKSPPISLLIVTKNPKQQKAVKINSNFFLFSVLNGIFLFPPLIPL